MMILSESREHSLLAIPPHADQYIRLQRTHYAPSEPLAVSFSRDIWGEYETFQQHLPATARVVLDIGCGIGGIDVPLFAHYGKNPAMRFHMLDKTELAPKVYYGFQPHGAFYNSLAITREFLESNGIPGRNIHLLEATADHQLRVNEPVDVAISLLSWGYHYPVSTYLRAVHQCLAPGGRLILDVRENTEGEAQLKTVFAEVTRVWEGNSAWRVVAVK